MEYLGAGDTLPMTANLETVKEKFDYVHMAKDIIN